MSDEIKKMTRVLIQPTRNLSLRLHVKLLKEKDGRKENFHQVFTVGKDQYLKLDLQSFITLEMINTEWAKDKSILIDQRNIYQILQAFEKALKGIYEGGVFAVNKKNEIVIYKDMVEKHTVQAFNIGTHQRLVIKPAIIYDENEVSYEGVILFINKTSNFVELPIDAFESLYYCLKQVDLFVYSQALLNYYVSTMKNTELEPTEVKIEEKETKQKKKHPLLAAEKEFVESTVAKPQTPEEFFGFNKTE